MALGGACFLIALNGRRGAGPHLRNSLGRKPSRFVSASSVCLEARKQHGEAPSPTSPLYQKYRRSCLARAASRSQFSDILLRKPRLALISRLESSESWLRLPCFEAHRKIARKLLMRHLSAVLGLKFYVYRCSLARATGPFSLNGSFFLVEIYSSKGTAGKSVSGRSGVAQSSSGPA